MSREAQQTCEEKLRARLSAYGLSPPCVVDLSACRRRRWIGAGVIAVVLLLGELAHAACGEPMTNYWVRLSFFVIEVPALTILASATYDYALRRRLTPLTTIALTCAVGILTGIGLMTAFWSVGHWVPAVRAFPNPNRMMTLLQAIAFGAVMGPMHVAVWALAFVYPFAAHDARVRGIEAEKLRTSVELARLRGHLEPHFLLNTLNAIAGLVTEDPKEARRLIATLGDLLRDALKDGDELQTLEQEMSWLRRYAAILEARHRGALSFEWEVEPCAGAVLLPPLLLQPLLENAVRHGALRRAAGGRVVVRASREPAAEGVHRVVCTIEDNGPGLPDRPIRSGAIGLKLVRRRLELHFKDADLRLESSDQGTRASVVFFERAAAHSAKPAGLGRSGQPARVAASVHSAETS